jgi:hypothetical protein
MSSPYSKVKFINKSGTIKKIDLGHTSHPIGQGVEQEIDVPNNTLYSKYEEVVFKEGNKTKAKLKKNWTQPEDNIPAGFVILEVVNNNPKYENEILSTGFGSVKVPCGTVEFIKVPIHSWPAKYKKIIFNPPQKVQVPDYLTPGRFVTKDVYDIEHVIRPKKELEQIEVHKKKINKERLGI